MTPHAILSSSDRLGMMLFIAACLHLLLILGISFELEEKNKLESRQKNIEIMVVQRPKEPPKPDELADFLAQVSQSGGGKQGPKEKPVDQAAAVMQAPPPPL